MKSRKNAYLHELLSHLLKTALCSLNCDDSNSGIQIWDNWKGQYFAFLKINVCRLTKHKYCWIVSSCLAAYILPQLAFKVCATQRLWPVNPTFYSLIGYFKHFDKHCSEPNTLNSFEFLNEVGHAARAIRLGRWKDTYIYYNPFFYMYIYYAKCQPTLYSGPPGKLPVLQMASPPLSVFIPDSTKLTTKYIFSRAAAG